MNSHHSPDLVIDPVCGMSLPLARAATSLQAEAGIVYFCSRGCRNRFQADPDRYPPAAAGRGLAGCDHGRALANGGLTAVGLPAGAGLAAASVLLAIYFSVLGLLSGWRFTLLQFEEFWPYIIALAVGFHGVQELLAVLAWMRQSSITAELFSMTMPAPISAVLSRTTHRTIRAGHPAATWSCAICTARTCRA